MTDGREAGTPLSRDEVMAILDRMEGADPILVGGQSVNVWAQHYNGRHLTLQDTSRFVSKDVDVFDNMPAARKPPRR